MAMTAAPTALLRASDRIFVAGHRGMAGGAICRALQRGGYATDPAYARKLTAVADAIDRLMANRTDSTGV
jgi:GDP-L-fucose synthase